MAELDVLVAVAKELLDSLGKQVVIKRKSTRRYDHTKLKTVNGATESQSIRVTPPEQYVTRYEAGNATKTASGRTFASPVGLQWEPKAKNFLVIDGQDREVVYVQAHYSGDEIVLYELGLNNT